MAAAILSSIIKWMINNVVKAPSIATASWPLSSQQCEVQEDLLKLERTLLRIQAVLSDAEEREIRDESVKLWLTELKGLAYDAEDVLRDYGYEMLRAKAEGQGLPWPTTGKRKLEEVSQTIAAASISIPTKVSDPDGMARRIQEIRMKFDEIAEARKDLRLREDDGVRKVDSKLRPPPTTPYVNESCVYGREDDKKWIVDTLLSESGRGENFSVIPIVGMGGIGKTTLVRLVYNDSRVRQYFNSRVWINVSLDFDVVRLCKAIIQSITMEPCELTELSAVQQALKEELKGKKLLLVLDDVWNEKLNLWDNFRVALTGGGWRKIIVTTRNESVARIMQTVLPYRLGCLPEDQSWLLFQQCAFDGLEPKEHPNLVEIGEKIVRKCNGLPLALKTLGGLLRFETAEERWEDILHSDLWELDEEEDDILPALKLSYHWMPTHLKPCFIYCSLFPKNYLFKKDHLVKLWMGEGLIQYKKNRRDEDTGRQYFDDLLRRSFFQFSQIDLDELPQIRDRLHFSQVSDGDELLQKFLVLSGNGDHELFVMHDLISDLAQSIAGKECCIIKDEKVSNITTEARHLSLIPFGRKEKEQTKSAMFESRVLRTLLYINRMVNTWDRGAVGDGELLDVNMHKDLFLNLGCLRVMDLSYTRVKELPDSISQLKHLCYLGLQGSKIQSLPDSICNFYYLQTLDLKYCNSLRQLPKGIVKLINLRHLELPMKDFASEVSLPPGIGKLTSLQTLSAFNVGRDSRHCRIDELKQLRNLRGQLGIAGLQNVASGKEAREAKLKGKEHLQTLALSWSVRDGDRPSSSKNKHMFKQGDDEDNLNMAGTMEATDQSLTVDKFVADCVLESLEPNSNLRELIVRGYYGTKFPSWLGDQTFSRLTTVVLSKCHNCKFLPPLGQLPCLQDLLIGKMNGVQNVGSEFLGHIAASSSKAFQALKKLDVEWMKEWEEWNGVKDGDFPCLRSLVIKHCSKLQGLPLLSSSLEELEMEDVEGLTALPALRSLKSLDLGGKWNNKLWSSSLELKTLQSLRISFSMNLRILHLHEILLKLKNLEIEHCPKLTSVVGLHELPSLERLELYALPELQISPDYQLPSSLQTFHVTSCANMTLLPLHQHLPVLKELSIINCPQLVSVVGLQNLVSLESLSISACPELLLSLQEVLPPSLQSLEISSCDKLNSLPLLHENLSALEELKIEDCQQLATVVGLHNLASLQCMEISFCPLLQFSTDEQLRSSNVDIDIMECPGLTEWCQRHGIKQVQNDDWDDEGLDEDKFDVDEEAENYSECEDEAKENWDGPEAVDDID
ncbi:putative disease resistance protein RGA3 [Phoenix dactylifera]|uniref:Disease resistance protein RGA3 n=1 Tax=Phoenix dactylifera TaxID=42345 RepID=A0A8B7CSZ0_PHODC|nr:putative disease resistance protein RGA3 [Phoenix dactylifera]